MAYMSQERKKAIVAKCKPILKKYGVKATFSTDRSSLNCNIKSSKIDFIGEYNSERESNPSYRPTTYMDINVYHYRSHFTGKALEFLEELIPAMNEGNHDNSDIQTDYFDVGWYVHVKIGKWDKPYILEK